MQSSSEQPLVGEEHCVTTRITAAKETKCLLTVLGKNGYNPKTISNIVVTL